MFQAQLPDIPLQLGRTGLVHPTSYPVSTPPLSTRPLPLGFFYAVDMYVESRPWNEYVSL